MFVIVGFQQEGTLVLKNPAPSGWQGIEKPQSTGGNGFENRQNASMVELVDSRFCDSTSHFELDRIRVQLTRAGSLVPS